ncbi:helix-turn-helix domain-containing protein [Fulvivirga kasyanovii]|uniref:XRE family transcriptional regulator n=1 Tax=Fulvivirga kasyanovii TaxID=396812 RepID=A0ABW9RI78_9BACT|nr:XRE family transcriptional regulator [Fulvivirga kasyanovii]
MLPGRHSLKSLSRYELGTSIPPANALKEIANALGVSADALLGFREGCNLLGSARGLQPRCT